MQEDQETYGQNRSLVLRGGSALRTPARTMYKQCGQDLFGLESDFLGFFIMLARLMTSCPYFSLS
jgi:hypothetical protein